jgi:hypothetical protein
VCESNRDWQTPMLGVRKTMAQKGGTGMQGIEDACAAGAGTRSSKQHPALRQQ